MSCRLSLDREPRLKRTRVEWNAIGTSFSLHPPCPRHRHTLRRARRNDVGGCEFERFINFRAAKPYGRKMTRGRRILSRPTGTRMTGRDCAGEVLISAVGLGRMPKSDGETGILSPGWFLDIPMIDVQSSKARLTPSAAESLAMTDPRQP